MDEFRRGKYEQGNRRERRVAMSLVSEPRVASFFLKSNNQKD